jgi:MFS family permease
MPPPVISSNIRLRIVGTIFAVSSLVSAAQIAYFTLTSIIAADLSGSDSLAGIPSTLGMVGRALSAYPIGWLMGRVGRRYGLSLGLFFGVVGTLVSAWAIGTGSFWVFSIGAGLAGAARGAADLGRYAAAEVNPPDSRARALGLVVFAGTIGAIAGPLLVVPSTQIAAGLNMPSDSGPYLIGAILSALSLILTFIFLRPDPLILSRLYDQYELENNTDPARSVDVKSRPMIQLLGVGHVRLGMAAMTIGQLVMVMIMVITPLHMSHAGHDTGDISLVIMAHTLGMFGLSTLTGWFIDRIGPVAVVIIGAIMLVAASIISPLVTSLYGLAGALFLLGLAWNLCFIAGSSLLASGLGPAERGRVQGTSDTLASAAAALGSLGTGPLFAVGEFLMVSAVGLALALGLFALSFLWRRSKTDSSIPAGSIER